MKKTIDDLPIVKVSALVARGDIGPSDKAALIRFGDDGVEYGVGVRIRRFANGGFYALFVCPRCDGNARRLRLLDDAPACGECVRKSGLIYRSQATRTEQRHLVTAPQRIANLNARGGFRVHRPNRKVEGRARIEAALRRSIIVARQFGHDEFAERVKRLSRHERS
jgi:hypothetical protein